MFSRALPQHILYKEPIKYGKTNEITRVDLVINYLVVNLVRIYLDSSFKGRKFKLRIVIWKLLHFYVEDNAFNNILLKNWIF